VAFFNFLKKSLRKALKIFEKSRPAGQLAVFSLKILPIVPTLTLTHEKRTDPLMTLNS
jgi:hypothetical protein